MTGMEAPDEQEPGILRLRASLAGRSTATERFRCDFLKLLAEFPFIGGEVTTTAGSCIRFGVLSAGEGGTLTEVRENGIPQVSGAAELLLRVDGMSSAPPVPPGRRSPPDSSGRLWRNFCASGTG